MIQLHPEFLMKNGKKEFAVLSYEEFVVLQEALEDANDVLDLREAKVAEAAAETVLLSDVKKQLGLD